MKDEIARAVELIEQTVKELTLAYQQQKEAGEAAARADHAYRQAQAAAWLRVKADSTLSPKPTEAHAKAIVDDACDREMLACRLAEAARDSATLNVKRLMTQTTALQTVLNAYRAEGNAIGGGFHTGA